MATTTGKVIPSPEKSSVPSYDSDKATMAEHEPRLLEINETGHVQELERNFSLISVCSVGIVCIFWEPLYPIKCLKSNETMGALRTCVPCLDQAALTPRCPGHWKCLGSFRRLNRCRSLVSFEFSMRIGAIADIRAAMEAPLVFSMSSLPFPSSTG
jgi:hypothetical protein